MNRLMLLAGLLAFAGALLVLADSAEAIASDCCGNGFCHGHNNGEDCRNCPEDCGECRSPVGCAGRCLLPLPVCVANGVLDPEINTGCIPDMETCIKTYCDDPPASLFTDGWVPPRTECPTNG